MTNWLEYMNANIRHSFTQYNPTARRGQYEFHNPIPPAPNWEPNSNFWAYGLSYYATAKLIDHHPLMAFAKLPREILDKAITWGNDPRIITSIHRETYASVQYECLISIANRDRVILEHVVVLNMATAIELILKALQAHASKRDGQTWPFHKGHDLSLRYSKLHSELRTELQTEYAVFIDKYRKQVEQVPDLHKKDLEQFKQLINFPHNQPERRHSIDEWRTNLNQIIDGLNSGAYTYIPQSDPSTVDLSLYGANSLADAIGKIPPIEINRYGPKEGPDHYPTNEVRLAIIIGQFFYEHLFPPPPFDEDTPVHPIEHWRRDNLYFY